MAQKYLDYEELELQKFNPELLFFLNNKKLDLLGRGPVA
jgi:hypothetical protein